MRTRTVERGDARHAGAAKSDARNTDVAKPGRVARKEAELSERALAYALVMPANQFFTHLTAALLWGVPLPPRLILAAPLEPDVGVLSPARVPRNHAVRGHAVHADRAGVVTHPRYGVRLASPATTWAMLGTVLTDLRDLVAVGDALVREQMFTTTPPPLTTIAKLAGVVGSGRRVGIASLREALPLIRTRSASRPETWLRLLVVGAGLPEPEANWELWVDGTMVAVIDLPYPELKIAIEYEGEHHLTDGEQWDFDIARYEDLAARGWIVVRVTKEQLFGRPENVLKRVRRARADRL
ncbi:endonuclease domain-containing protein [Occultella aeris]|uniref:DUF559 domain-containing protein n=1 Tax=Occultella aeris TaxID=2761496 RepID=A0A7M4DHU7_9MICO|nr:hypothetical protein [Occultella aeris]VZO36494.1 hypothetical protein HALOF300_01698 [Occultella aeris]